MGLEFPQVDGGHDWIVPKVFGGMTYINFMDEPIY
jgi:hypothetical protein